MKSFSYLLTLSFIFLYQACCSAQEWVDPSQKVVGFTPQVKVRAILEKGEDKDWLSIAVKYDDDYNSKVQADLSKQYPDDDVHYSPVKKAGNLKVKLLFGQKNEIQIWVNDNMNPVYETQNYLQKLSSDDSADVRSLLSRGEPIIQIEDIPAKLVEYKEEKRLVATYNCSEIFSGLNTNIGVKLEEFQQWKIKQNDTVAELGEGMKSCLTAKSSGAINSMSDLFNESRLSVGLNAGAVYSVFYLWKGYEGTVKQMKYVISNEVIEIGHLQ